LTISSWMKDTGWRMSNPTRRSTAPIMPTAIADGITTSGAERRPVSRAAATSAIGRSSAARIGYE